MGGDNAPQAIAAGALAAATEAQDVEIYLVGQAEAVAACLPAELPANLHLVPAKDVVGMEEHPAKALRRKPESSIAVCGHLLRERKVQALVSAGNTGAVIAASLFAARLLPGVHRPGIAVSFPSRHGTTVLCDVGANIQCKPVHYLQYAVMASAYCQDVLGVASPRVGLLNIGTEESKGSTELRSIRGMLEKAAGAGLINFVGAVEGNHIFEGEADVVVCDGFVGNTILKAAEGTGRVVMETLEARLAQALEGLSETPQAAQAFREAIGELKSFTDYSTYGGAPLLGIDGCAIIAHGRSNPRAVKHAILVARDFALREVNAHITQRLEELAAKGVAT